MLGYLGISENSESNETHIEINIFFTPTGQPQYAHRSTTAH